MVSMKIGGINRNHDRAVDCIKIVFVCTIEFRSVTVTGVVAVPPESINGDGFIVFHFRDQKNRNKRFGADEEKNLFLNASLSEDSASNLGISEIHHCSMSVVVLYFLGSIFGKLHVH